MGALNAAPGQNPFAFELQGELSHHAQSDWRAPLARCNNLQRSAETLHKIVHPSPFKPLVLALGFRKRA